MDKIKKLFVGRTQELQALKEHFQKGGKHAWILGERGSGKTALAYMFCDATESSNLFPGGLYRISAAMFSPHTFQKIQSEVIPINTKNRTLLLIDDYDSAPAVLRKMIASQLARNPNLNSIICAVRKIQREQKNVLTIKLGGLSNEEFYQLLRLRFNFTGAEEEQARRLFELVSGQPLYAELAGNTIREHLVTLNEFISGLGEFHHLGILGPDGKPLTKVPQGIQIAVVDTNASLLEKIRSDPSLLRDISPRRFEEIVADLLSLQGYDVDLTPPSQDGGFDIFAARKDGLGTFLFLVECKRYTPPSKVGVSIVRSLHGVVEQKQANAGIVVTSSFFTKGAKEFQQSIPYQIQLRDYIDLQRWLGILKDKQNGN